MSYKRKISPLVNAIGNKGVDLLTDLLDQEAAKADEPWKRTLLDLLADAGRRYGPEGFAMAQNAVERLLDKKEVEIRQITKNLLIASNLLAQLQNAEAAKKERAKKWLQVIGASIGTILKAAVGKLL